MDDTAKRLDAVRMEVAAEVGAAYDEGGAVMSPGSRSIKGQFTEAEGHLEQARFQHAAATVFWPADGSSSPRIDAH